MRVRNGQIIEHWGVGNIFSLMRQLTGNEGVVGQPLIDNIEPQMCGGA
jgi:hypothetical protein